MNRIRLFLSGDKEDVAQAFPGLVLVLVAGVVITAVLFEVVLWSVLAVFSIHDYLRPMTMEESEAYLSSGQFYLDQIRVNCGDSPANCSKGDALAKSWGMTYEFDSVEGIALVPMTRLFCNSPIGFDVIDPITGELKAHVRDNAKPIWPPYYRRSLWIENAPKTGDRVRVSFYKLYCKGSCLPAWTLAYVQKLPGVALSPWVSGMLCKPIASPPLGFRIFHCPWW